MSLSPRRLRLRCPRPSSGPGLRGWGTAPRWGLALLAVTLAACSSDCPRQVDLTLDAVDPDPGRRTRAAVAMAESGDRRHVPTLIALLEDPNDGVRTVAHGALVTLTGRTSDLAPFAAPSERQAAIAGWQAWWQTQQAAPPSGPEAGGQP